MAVEERVADDRCEAAEGGVILGGVDRLDRCQDGRGGDREGGVEGVIEVCFAGVGEDRALICYVSACREEGRGNGERRTSSMPPETRMSMSLRKWPCRNRYPGKPGTRFLSTAGPAPVLGSL